MFWLPREFLGLLLLFFFSRVGEMHLILTQEVFKPQKNSLQYTKKMSPNPFITRPVGLFNRGRRRYEKNLVKRAVSYKTIFQSTLIFKRWTSLKIRALTMGDNFFFFLSLHPLPLLLV